MDIYAGHEIWMMNNLTFGSWLEFQSSHHKPIHKTIWKFWMCHAISQGLKHLQSFSRHCFWQIVSIHAVGSKFIQVHKNNIYSTVILLCFPKHYTCSIQNSLSAFILGADLCLHGPHNWHFQLHCKQLINMHGFPSQYQSKQSRLESWDCQGGEMGQTCQGQDFVNEGRAAE